MEKITTQYGEVEIVYNENDNRWEFEHNGKFRFATTLKLAKDAIDKAPKPKKAPFEKFEAYYISFLGSRSKLVTVTSFDGGYAWVIKDGRRSKEPLSLLYVRNERNDQIVKEIAAMEDAKEALRKKQDQKERELQKLEAPEED